MMAAAATCKSSVGLEKTLAVYDKSQFHLVDASKINRFGVCAFKLKNRSQTQCLKLRFRAPHIES